MRQQYVDMEYVRNNPNKYWNKFTLSRNKQLTVKDVETLILTNSINDWDWCYISRYINIQQIRDNPNELWNLHWLSMNDQLTVKDIDTLILPNNVGEWHWDSISVNIIIQEVINNPHKPWDKDGLLCNRDITEKILEFFDAGLLRHLQKNIYTFRYHIDIIVKCEY